MSAIIKSSEQENYRKMQTSDLVAVMAIEEHAYLYPWSHDIFRDCIKAGYECWVAEKNNQIAAYTVFINVVGECHLLNICVDPAEQGKGVGRRLLEEILIYVTSRGASCAFLEVRPSNIHAIKLYESEGFNEVGIRKKYYPAKSGREDAIIFAKEL